jgi:hypothetical protein
MDDGKVVSMPLLSWVADADAAHTPASFHIDDAAAWVVADDQSFDPSILLEALNKLRELEGAELYRAVAERHGWSCYVCGKSFPRLPKDRDPLLLDVEHVIPIRHGGAHWWPNLRLVHRLCIGPGKTDRSLARAFDVAFQRWTGDFYHSHTRAQKAAAFQAFLTQIGQWRR